MIDMHAHICSYTDPVLAEKELAFRSDAGIYTFFSTCTPDELQFMHRLRKKVSDTNDPGFSITFGIHPWYADQWDPEDYLDYFRDCPMIGEIGMDSLWCNVPLERQQKVLEKQLTIAYDLKKPIVLHTKGCEPQISQIIQDYPWSVLIHWYSGDPESLFTLIDQGCFFTLGPDTGLSGGGAKNRLLLENVPLDHLFLETDGLDAIRWAYGELHPERFFTVNELNKIPDLSLIRKILKSSGTCIAKHYAINEEEISVQMEHNLHTFLYGNVFSE